LRQAPAMGGAGAFGPIGDGGQRLSDEDGSAGIAGAGAGPVLLRVGQPEQNVRGRCADDQLARPQNSSATPIGLSGDPESGDLHACSNRDRIVIRQGDRCEVLKFVVKMQQRQIDRPLPPQRRVCPILRVHGKRYNRGKFRMAVAIGVDFCGLQRGDAMGGGQNDAAIDDNAAAETGAPRRALEDHDNMAGQFGTTGAGVADQGKGRRCWRRAQP